LFATRFHELADAAEAMDHAGCMAMDASAGRYKEVFAYKVVPGRAGDCRKFWGQAAIAIGSMQTCGVNYAAVAVASPSFTGRKPE
jgi:hypothetical protein